MFLEKDQLFNVPERSVSAMVSGGFARRIVVLCEQETGAFDNRGFLTKILAAARINLEADTLFAEISRRDAVSLLPLLKEKQPEQVLIFGLPPAQLGILAEIPRYQPQFFYGTTFLIADALSALEPDKARKAQLWQALQQLFL